MDEYRFNKKIYDLQQISLAIKAYSDITQINVMETEDYFILCFHNCKYLIERTVREFENYLIDLTNKNQKW